MSNAIGIARDFEEVQKRGEIVRHGLADVAEYRKTIRRLARQAKVKISTMAMPNDSTGVFVWVKREYTEAESQRAMHDLFKTWDEHERLDADPRSNQLKATGDLARLLMHDGRWDDLDRLNEIQRTATERWEKTGNPSLTPDESQVCKDFAESYRKAS